MKNGLSTIDLEILKRLESAGRTSVRELAGLVGMSPPSVAEKIKKLEERGIIRGYTIEIDRLKLGFTLEAIVRIKPRSGQIKHVEDMIDKQSRFVQCDRITGDDCYIARLALKSIGELDEILERFHHFAETNTSIVKSSLIRKREPLEI